MVVVAAVQLKLPQDNLRSHAISYIGYQSPPRWGRLKSGVRPHANKMDIRMKILVPLTFASILLVSACAKNPQGNADVTAAGTAPSTSSMQTYQCESGEKIAAAYPATDSATVQYKGSSYEMKIAVSASGSRYVGGEMEWWTKGSGTGSEGTLFRHMADEGKSGDVIEACKAL